MAPFYEMLRVMTDWLVKRGVKRNNAQKYITSLFLALSEDAVVNSKENLKNLVKESQTPKGLNEQGVKELTKAGFYRSLERTCSVSFGCSCYRKSLGRKRFCRRFKTRNIRSCTSIRRSFGARVNKRNWIG